jgi:hypothetical protein
MECCCEQGNKYSGATECWEITEQLSECWLLKKDSVPQSYPVSVRNKNNNEKKKDCHNLNFLLTWSSKFWLFQGPHNCKFGPVCNIISIASTEVNLAVMCLTTTEGDLVEPQVLLLSDMFPHFICKRKWAAPTGVLSSLFATAALTALTTQYEYHVF